MTARVKQTSERMRKMNREYLEFIEACRRRDGRAMSAFLRGERKRKKVAK